MRHIEEALTFDDVMLAPGYSEVLPRDADLATVLVPGIPLSIPIVSAAMDMVTEARLAIALAEEGGIGIVHRNLPPVVQADKVRRVKKFESGVVRDPITVSPDTTIGQVAELTRRRKISGVPVVEGERLVGIVTGRDLRFETRWNDPVSLVMTPEDKLVTVGEDAGRDEIISLLHEHRIEKLLVTNGNGALRGLITVKDIQRAEDYPNACKDDQGRLRVGAAVGTGPDTDERVEALAAAGVGRGGGGYRPRALPGRAVAGAPRAGRLPAPARGRRERSDRRGRRRPRGGGRECGQGGHRAGLDLHHAGGRGGRGAAAHRDRPGWRRSSTAPAYPSSRTAGSATPATWRRRSRRAPTR